MRIPLFILVLLLTFSTQSYAEDYDCKAEKQNITRDLMQDVECTHDEECGYFSYGYPFQPDACVKAIINIKKENHNISNMRLIAEYNNNCVNPNEKERKKKEDFVEQLAKAVCADPVRVYCYKGYCRSQSYAIYNNE